MDPENQNFEKMKKKKKKKTLEDIIILQMFNINHSHMIYGFSDIECIRQIFFVILDHFLPFYSPNNPKNQNFEKLKQAPADMIILQSVPKIMIIYCTVLRYGTNGFNCYFSFGAIFRTFTSLTAQKIKNVEKVKKPPWRSHDFTIVYQKS